MSGTNKLLCKDCSGPCGIINSFDSETANNYARSIANVFYKKKETLIKQNSLTSNIYYIKTGLVKLFTERRNDKNILLQIATPGHFIGITHLHSEVFNFTAMAVQDCEVCILPKSIVLHLMLVNEKFRESILIEHAQQSRYFIDKISSLGTKQMHGRLC